MSIDAIIAMLLFPYTINIESKEQDLEKLYQDINNTTDPIISLQMLKNTFDIDKYEVHTHVYQEMVLNPEINESKLSVGVKEALQRMKDRAMIKEGKQYVNLTKEEIKNLIQKHVDQKNLVAGFIRDFLKNYDNNCELFIKTFSEIAKILNIFFVPRQSYELKL